HPSLPCCGSCTHTELQKLAVPAQHDGPLARAAQQGNQLLNGADVTAVDLDDPVAAADAETLCRRARRDLENNHACLQRVDAEFIGKSRREICHRCPRQWLIAPEGRYITWWRFRRLDQSNGQAQTLSATQN